MNKNEQAFYSIKEVAKFSKSLRNEAIEYYNSKIDIRNAVLSIEEKDDIIIITTKINARYDPTEYKIKEYAKRKMREKYKKKMQKIKDEQYDYDLDKFDI